MAELSGRARRMLERGTRGPHPTGAEMARLLDGAGVPATDALLDAAARFGGSAYRVRGRDEVMPVRVALLWPGVGAGVDDEVLADLPVPGDERCYVAYVDHGLGESYFRLDGDGTLYIDRLPMAASIDTFLESEALLDELRDVASRWHEVRVEEVTADAMWLDSRIGLPFIPAASDRFTIWWGDDDARVSLGCDGVVLAYTRTSDEAKALVDIVRGRPAGLANLRAWPLRPGYGES